MGATTIIDKVRLNLSDEQRQKIMVLSSKIEDVKLRKTVSSGVAFHHAGLCVNDKKLIEEYFRSASLPILFSTNTLAMGVNLPAYLSIIKSTEVVGATVSLISHRNRFDSPNRCSYPVPFMNCRKLLYYK